MNAPGDFERHARGKKRKGGLHQRMARVAEDRDTPSALYMLLITMLAQGILSGVQCHQISVAARRDLDGSKNDQIFNDLARLARLQRGQNLVRSVYTLLSKTTALPPPLQAPLPYKDGVHPAFILLPHELFAYMWDHQDVWKRKMLSDPNKLREFWTSMDGHPAMFNHPLRDYEDFQDWCLPISIHGDEVPVFGIGKIWSRSCLSFSWCSIVQNALGGACAEIMLYIFGLFEKFAIDSNTHAPGTMESFFKILAWSFQAMWEGKWPSHDWRGVAYRPGTMEWIFGIALATFLFNILTYFFPIGISSSHEMHATNPTRSKKGLPLAGGYFCALIACIGDLDYFQKWLGTPASTSHRAPCIQCRCKFRGPTSWLDNRPNSEWQNTLLQADTWRQQWNSPCLLLKLPGVSCWTITYDLMHNFWLGWLQFAYGSIFYLLCFDILEADPLTNLKAVAAFIREFQRQDKGHQRYRQRLEKLSMFVKQSGYPKLKGRASDIKGLCAALKACWMANMRGEVLQDQQIAAFLELNLEIHDLLEAYSPKYGFMSIPAPQCDELYTKGLAMAQLHVCLLEHYEQENVQIWNLTSKTHYCLHTFYLARWLHPSLTWAFKGESTMKAVQTLWKSCLAGNKHWAVCKIAAFKMRHLMHLKDEKA